MPLEHLLMIPRLWVLASRLHRKVYPPVRWRIAADHFDVFA